MADAPVTRVLVVDDTEGNRYVTSRLLRSVGYEVVEAADGTQALEIVKRDQPDLVVLDVNLPDMTGYKVAEHIRALTKDRATPVLHLSASYTTQVDRAEGLERGADGYLTHPLEPEVFTATVRSLLRTGAADRRLQEAAREWQATFDALSDSVFLIDNLAVVRQANKCACELLGTSVVVDVPLAELFERAFHADQGKLIDLLLEGQQLEKELFEIGGNSYLVTAEPIHDGAVESRIVVVLEDVSERMAADRERTELLRIAEEARQEAESANRAKNEFLAVMSHELRTPLNAIGGYAQLIELGIRGPVTEAQKSDIERIKRSQTYLLSLINDVLNFAKIEAGHLVVDMVPVPIAELVAGMRDFVEPQLQERRLTFSCEVCEEPVRASADAEKVQQVLINLLSNALKFTPAGGAIDLGCTADAEHVIIYVKDTGKGIASDKLDTIFEPFVQVDRRFKREQEGIGLGLAISRELARAMNGELTAASSEGGGAAFTLTLARAADATS